MDRTLAAAAVAGGVLLLAAATPRTAQAQLSFYTSRTTFTSANPGLTAENFENAPGGSDRLIIGDISSTTAGMTLLTVVPGIRIQAIGAGSPDEFYYNRGVIGPVGYSQGNGSNVITTNWPNDRQEVTFTSSQVNAFGTDLGGNSYGGAYTISIFNTLGILLGTTTSAPASGTFSFFGVTSTEAIGRISLSAPGYETTDNMLFGQAGATVNPVPEPSEWLAMGMAGASVGGLMLRARARRRKK
jgi:hypothetical protein